jgi:hypothetical protein
MANLDLSIKWAQIALFRWRLTAPLCGRAKFWGIRVGFLTWNLVLQRGPTNARQASGAVEWDGPRNCK